MNFLFYAMIILMVVMTISNVRKMKSFGNERGFIDVYGKVLDGQDKAREELEEYLNTNQIEYLNAKAMLVKIYDDLRNGLEYREDIEKLNLAPLFTSNGQFSKEMFNKNCDVFIWLSLIYAVNIINVSLYMDSQISSLYLTNGQRWQNHILMFR